MQLEEANRKCKIASRIGEEKVEVPSCFVLKGNAVLPEQRVDLISNYLPSIGVRLKLIGFPETDGGKDVESGDPW